MSKRWPLISSNQNRSRGFYIPTYLRGQVLCQVGLVRVVRGLADRNGVSARGLWGGEEDSSGGETCENSPESAQEEEEDGDKWAGRA